MYRIFCQVTCVIVSMTAAIAAAQPALPSIQYLSPKPSSTRVAQEATVIIRFNALDPNSVTNFDSFVTVRGSRSGPIEGSVTIASDERTIIFRPSILFANGEEASVRIHPVLAGAETAIDSSYAFQISQGIPADTGTYLEAPPADGSFPQVSTGMGSTSRSSDSGDPVVLNGVSIPSDFPLMHVLASNNPSPGYLFLTNWGGQPYNMILDNTGAPLWYWKTPDRRRDFKVQPNGWLTMLVRRKDDEADGFIALDSTYSLVETMRTTAGYFTDEHELTMLPDGHYFLIGRRESRVDMSRYVVGGQTNATVRETVIQEFTPAGELIFLWRSWDNFDIRDLEIDNLRGGYIRFPHMNAVSIDDDGHILVSSRHLSEVTKINRQTGEIIWRLGGAHNQFTWIDDPLNGFTSQHDIRALGGNHYTIFDNGNLHFPPETRAVEYEIDPINMTATLVWQYRHVPRRFTNWMGNAQRLPNGNTQINYADASLPKIVEVRPDGTKVLEMDFVSRTNCYRAFKFDWTGTAKRPYLLVENSSSKVTLLFNKFGDSDVDHYNVYGGRNPNPTDLIASSEEPFVHLTDLQTQTRYYFRVAAVNSLGEESDYSNEESMFVNLVEPGTNMVVNGEFTGRVFNWEFEVTGSAVASVATRPADELHLIITNGGTEYWNVQVRQGGLPLINGRKYRFEFDARAEQSRIFEAKVTKDGEPWTNYGKIGLTLLTEQTKHFVYDFVMDDPTDFSSRIVINAGTDPADVFVDNISMKELLPTTSAAEVGKTSQTFSLHQNFPNPFSGGTRIRYEVPENGRVSLRVFNLIGREVLVLVDEHQAAGSHVARFNSAGLPSGIYQYRLELSNQSGEFAETARMIYIRQ